MPSGEATGFDPVRCGFESHHPCQSTEDIIELKDTMKEKVFNTPKSHSLVDCTGLVNQYSTS